MEKSEVCIIETRDKLPDYVMGVLLIHHPQILKALDSQRIKIKITWDWEGWKLKKWSWDVVIN